MQEVVDKSLKALAEKRLSKQADSRAIDALTSYIANNPGVQYEDLVRKSLELGQDPTTLIDRALGSVIVDKGGLNLNKPTVDLLNEVYESNPVPGYRYVVDPNNVKSATGKEVAKDLMGNEGVARGWRYKGESRGKPDFIAIEDAKDELGKMKAVVAGGHELKHSENRMIRPHFKSIGEAGELGHHYGPGTFEAQDLIKQVRDLPEDEKVLKEIEKRSKGLDKSNFKTLRSVSSPLGALFQSFKDLYKDTPVKANPIAQAKIAAAYEAMKHDPTNPDVIKAYDALIKETEDQFEDLQKNKGLKISRIGENTPNPYKSSADLIKDVKQNKHMAYFPTEAGFGASSAADAVQNNPLLRETKFIGPDGKPMLANDLFRVVHDYYGHVEGENKFGPTGEERAYQQHGKMFSPEAKKALATETRGQNSWVNYGPFGEENRANPANTKYAEQKTGLLPTWATEDLNKVENPKLARLHGVATVAARALGPLAVASGIAPLAVDIKEGKPNTALARAVSYAAPVGAEQLTDELMQTAELKDTSPELFDPEYRKMLMRIGQKRMEQGKSPIIKSFSGKEVDTSKTEESDYLNRIKALQELSSKG